jgi:hypothetical protein
VLRAVVGYSPLTALSVPEPSALILVERHRRG